MEYKAFYSDQYANGEYEPTTEMHQHPFYGVLSNYINEHSELYNGKCLEIGSGRGVLQDIVEDYTGIDVSDSVEHYYHKPFISGGDAREMPFDNDTFDFVWSYAVWEHIPNPQKAFEETIRVIKNGGRLLLRPAWNCRPWAANGYQVRPYSDFGLFGKVYKFLIPILDSKIIRGIISIPCRLFWLLVYKLYVASNQPKLIYKKLRANYEVFWQSDSDACNSLDPYLTMLWFESRGCKVLSHRGLRKLLIMHDPVEIQIIKKYI